MLLRRQHVRRSQRRLQLLLRPADLGRCEVRTRPSHTSFWLTVYSHVDMLGVWYTSVNFAAGKSPGSPTMRPNTPRES